MSLLILNKDEMIRMVSAYLENTVSSQEIANWADDVHRQLVMDAQILDLDKIPYVSFLSTLGQLKDDEKWRNVRQDGIFHILDILSGRDDAGYTMRFQVPVAFGVPRVRDAFNNLRSDAANMETLKKILKSWLVNNRLTDNDVSMFVFISQKLDTDRPIITVLDLILSQIKTEINSLNTLDARLIIHPTRRIHLLFPTDRMRDEKLFISRLIQLIKYYLGYDYFNIFCLFKSGMPHLSLLP